MLNLKKTVEKINREWYQDYKAELKENGIAISHKGELVMGCDLSGRTWAAVGFENEQESFENAINYPNG